MLKKKTSVKLDFLLLQVTSLPSSCSLEGFTPLQDSTIEAGLSAGRLPYELLSHIQLPNSLPHFKSNSKFGGGLAKEQQEK